MAAVTLQVEDALLEKVSARARDEGISLEQGLHWLLEAYGDGAGPESLRNILDWAKSRGFFVPTPLPSREERMAR